jgi:hypothetical protein
MKTYFHYLFKESLLETILLSLMIWCRGPWDVLPFAIFACSIFVILQSLFCILIYFLLCHIPFMKVFFKIMTFLGLYPGIAVIFCCFLLALGTNPEHYKSHFDVIKTLFVKDYNCILSIMLLLTKCNFFKQYLKLSR